VNPIVEDEEVRRVEQHPRHHEACDVVSTSDTTEASDHLPLMAEMEVGGD
jgi:endonuclease/exonuclease/phosphatase family metal-dependent hydrolase